MKKLLAIHAIALCLQVVLVPVASARSVSYTGDGEGEGGPSIAQSCDVPDGYLDVHFDVCWGIEEGNNVLEGNLAWCTYGAAERNRFFDVVDVDGAAATLVFRQTLAGPVQLQFNGETDKSVDLPIFAQFNVTFGFAGGFARGDEIRFDFNPDPDDPTQTVNAIVHTISIHVGPYAYPFAQAIESGVDLYAGNSPVQAHKCQDPGSARH